MRMRTQKTLMNNYKLGEQVGLLNEEHTKLVAECVLVGYNYSDDYSDDVSLVLVSLLDKDELLATSGMQYSISYYPYTCKPQEITITTAVDNISKLGVTTFNDYWIEDGVIYFRDDKYLMEFYNELSSTQGGIR